MATARRASPRVGRWNLVVLIVLVLGSLAVRLPAIAPEPTCPPLTREFLFARAIYFDWLGDAVPAWRRNVSDAQTARMTHPAPPVAETVGAIIYKAAGRETPRTARALSAIYWTVAGVCFFLAARRWTSDAAALTGAAVLLFLPWTLPESRQFGATPLALMNMGLALLTFARYGEQPTRSRLVWSALATTAAIAVRPMTGFFLFPAFAAVRAERVPIRRALFDRDTWLFAAIATLPTMLFYGWALPTDPMMRTRVATDLTYGLLFQASFWRGWWAMIGTTITIPVFVAAVLLVPFARGRTLKTMLAAMWLGYVLYGIAFNFHTVTHPYYQALALPLIALSIASLGLLRSNGLLARSTPLVLAAVLMLAGGRSDPMAEPQAASEVAAYRAIGDLTGHSTRTVYMSECWGDSLGYYGEVAGRPWPTVYEVQMYKPVGAHGVPDITADARLQLASGQLGGAEYFISTDLAELARQPDLQRLLDERYRLIARTATYVVYDLRRPGSVP